ncbi:MULTISPECIES: hypothetical protein [unclassified Fusibacter]|uniref:hypothetical protein n=1 Tax=unclassified Fusibacter TaxID=2624464 RepID=UPI0010129161|nr:MULTISPECIES: hypothetical protein [unclassified Fusibacter]MCK8059430.1 hypothetical protein [Fusibacter sp. A2]NPE21106.1 hypothetical protein [Fusibacter sp. A1]RXV62376.1 hypothetical protein DWB64_04670 [Fusibacter sp. A1]
MESLSVMLESMENSLVQVQGVISSKLVVDEKDQIIECHIVADKKRHAKQISKDIQTVLAAKYEQLIDHRVISVAQVANNSLQEMLPRIIYKSVEVTKHGQHLTATVKYALQDVLFEGCYTDVATKNGEYRVVANATLEVVRKHLSTNEHIVLEGFKLHEIGGVQIANAVLTFMRGRQEFPLVGTAVVTEHAHDAYVKSVLDALNRVLFV